jgi:2-aminobenzoate-CoA ligase
MNKFDLVLDPKAMPLRINGLPELCYPERLNVTAAIFADAVKNQWLDRIAYYCRGQSWRYDALISGTRRIAAALRSIGVGPGERVVLRMVDSPDLVMALLAVKGLGAIAVPAFVQLRADEIAYRVRDSESRFIIVDADLLDEAAKAHDAGCGLEHVVVSPADPSGIYTALDDLAGAAAPFGQWADTGRDDVCLITYTSGTTGRPKGGAHCHADLMAAGDTFARYMMLTTEDDIFAGPPAIPFSMGSSFLIFYPLRFGAAAVLCPEKTVEAYVDAFNNHHPTIFISVPTFYHRLLAYHRAGGKLALDSFKTLLCAGEPLNPDFEIAWHEETGVPLSQLIGTTEMFHAFIGTRPGRDEIRRETLGKVCPGYEISVRDPDTFDEVPNGEHGLMCVRGPTSTVYWSPRDIQSESVRDGWTIVRDLIWRDDEGFIYFVSRQDDMIITGGLNVSPVEVERILARHPAVLECACVGAPDETGERSEVVKAFITLADGYTGNDALTGEIQEFFKGAGPPFMYPRKIEYVVSLPKSLTGKLQRSALKRQEFAKQGDA